MKRRPYDGPPQPGFQCPMTISMPHQDAMTTPTADAGLDQNLRDVLSALPGLQLALLFGSLAKGQARVDSDVDLAVQADHPLTAEERLSLMDAVAHAVQRPVDLIDLRTAGEPTRGQVVRHGRRVWGSAKAHGDLIYRQLVDQEDFLPLQRRILEERRRAWIGR